LKQNGVNGSGQFSTKIKSKSNDGMMPENHKDRSDFEEDVHLLNEFRSRREPEILGKLYSRYMPLVYGVCLKYLKDREEAKDGVMHIFEKLIREIPRYQIDNFRSWLHVVTKNYCLMQLRSGVSRKERYREWINDQQIFMETAYDLHPLDKEEGFADGEALEKCLEKLKEEQRSCVREFYYENRCYREISVRLCMDEKKVKSCIQNGKRNLKLCLEGKNAGKKQIQD
jgi:RNA polymerase sigma-70 factor (ECF subfamily)